ncbi:MAG: hypothetical protein ABIR18_08445 [Chitinophagaceae bacterium]
MNSKSNVMMSNTINASTIISWFFGILVFAIGVVNTFWGNDMAFGLFLILLSFVYFPPATDLFTKITGIPIYGIVKMILGLFIIWASIGVGELFGKIDIMLKSFQ